MRPKILRWAKESLKSYESFVIFKLHTPVEGKFVNELLFLTNKLFRKSVNLLIKTLIIKRFNLFYFIKFGIFLATKE